MKKTPYYHNIILAFLAASLFVAFLPLVFVLSFLGKIYPGVKVGQIFLENKKKAEAQEILRESIKVPPELVLTHEQQNFKINLKEIEFNIDFPQTVQAAYQFARTGNPIPDIGHILQILMKKDFQIALLVNFNEQKLASEISKIAEQINKEAAHPRASLENGILQIFEGIQGISVDEKALEKTIKTNLAWGNFEPILIPVKITNPSLSEKELNIFEERAKKLVNKKVELTSENQEFAIEQEELLAILNPFYPEQEPYLDEVIKKILDNLRPKIEKEPQNPTFIFAEDRITEFAPAKDGLTINQEEFKQKLIEALWKLENEDTQKVTFEVPVIKTPPKIQTKDINNLGIETLIGKGSSRFRGSTASRIHNIILASSRLNGLLIAPGEIFSFNKALGDVSKFTGYKEAYIIKEGKTVLGDGGGVCQVSTTLFRAALSAGLPIIERRAHSYRVSYYEQDTKPGFDATVFDPTADLKIKNDTPGHVLIQTHVDKKTSTLIFELYGTNDKRVARTTSPVITDIVPPPEDLYIDDPTLALGQVKQIEYKAWGAKVRFDYTVERSGEIIYQKTFYSNYRPWQAVYLRGTRP